MRVAIYLLLITDGFRTRIIENSQSSCESHPFVGQPTVVAASIKTNPTAYAPAAQCLAVRECRIPQITAQIAMATTFIKGTPTFVHEGLIAFGGDSADGEA